MPPYSVAIAGCGPSGLATALFLNRRGHRVTLFERFTEPKPVGSGLLLQPSGLSVLDALGLKDTVVRQGARIDRLLGRTVPAGAVALDVSYAALKPDMHGVAVHRSTLFRALFDAVGHSNAVIETGIEVTGVRYDAGALPILNDATGQTHGPYDLVVDATGARTQLHDLAHRPVKCRDLDYGALWATLPWQDGVSTANRLEQRYRAATHMIGVLPIGQPDGFGHRQAAFFWSLKASEHKRWQQRGLSAWKDEVLGLWPETSPLLDEILEPEQLTFAQYGHHTLKAPYGRRLAFIGDAAHSTSPQLGQGANMGLIDAQVLVHCLSVSHDLQQALARYAKARRLHVRLYQMLSLAFTPFFQSDNHILPVLRDVLVGRAGRLPLLRSMLARTVAGALIDPFKGVDVD